MSYLRLLLLDGFVEVSVCWYGSLSVIPLKLVGHFLILRGGWRRTKKCAMVSEKAVPVDTVGHVVSII